MAWETWPYLVRVWIVNLNESSWYVLFSFVCFSAHTLQRYFLLSLSQIVSHCSVFWPGFWLGFAMSNWSHVGVHILHSMGLFSYHVYSHMATLFIKIHPAKNLIWDEQDGGEEVDLFALNFLLLCIRDLLNTYQRTDTLLGVADSEVNQTSSVPTQNSQCKGGGRQKANHSIMWRWLWGNATRTHEKSNRPNLRRSKEASAKKWPLGYNLVLVRLG